MPVPNKKPKRTTDPPVILKIPPTFISHTTIWPITDSVLRRENLELNGSQVERN